MSSTIIGWFLFGLGILLAAYALVYPQWKNKTNIVQKNAAVRPGKPLLIDDRYGLCQVQSGEKLGNDSFKLELYADNGQTYHAKYYNGEITPYNEYNALVGSGHLVFITKKAFMLMENKPVTEEETIMKLRNELEHTKSQARIYINNPDEKVNKMVEWLATLEGSKKKVEVK